MKGISKNTTIILFIVLIFGIIAASIFGFMSGINYANKENKKQEIIEKVDKVTKDENEEKTKDKIIEVVANSDIEFVTDIRNTFDKFSNNECNIYIIKYNNIEVKITGKNILGKTGYNISNISVSIDGNKINKDLLYADNDIVYKNELDVAYIFDGYNTLYTIIANVDNDKSQPSSYIISFNQLGNVLLNEEDSHYYYSIGSIIDNNIEINNIISIYALGDYVYGDDLLNVCSSEYLNMVKDYTADTIVYSRKVYNYENDILNVIDEETRTIEDDKIQKAC